MASVDIKPGIFMKRITLLLALLVAGWGNAQAAPGTGNSVLASRILLIDSSSMPVGAGKATLIIGPLQRTNGVYTGDYRLKVFPYFFKNEKGRLAIVVSDKSLAEASQGKVVAITGTATTNGKKGKCRPIGAIATPVDGNHGTLKLWFTAGNRKMIFEPAYHFARNETVLVLAEATKIKP
jgi:hypothetical protein